MYICPKCKMPLCLEGMSYKCINGHSFDLSAKGHVNLLLSGKSGIHGDNKAMLIARREFLSAGFYADIINKLADIISSSYDGKSLIRVLDAGCGEGYYTGALYDALVQRNISAEIFGIDVSKDGVMMAAKKHKKCSFAVASVNSLPFADESFDYVLSLFAPIAEEEFARVLAPCGTLITVSPSPRHLWGLKEAVYDTVYENEETTFSPRLLKASGCDSYSRIVTLTDGKLISSLFQMTPYYYKTDEKGRNRALSLETLTTEIGFMFFRYTKPGII